MKKKENVGNNKLLYRFYSREDTEDAVKYISGTILDERPIRADFDWGFQDGRQWGRGRSGGQVRMQLSAYLCLIGMTLAEYLHAVWLSFNGIP